MFIPHIRNTKCSTSSNPSLQMLPLPLASGWMVLCKPAPPSPPIYFFLLLSVGFSLLVLFLLQLEQERLYGSSPCSLFLPSLLGVLTNGHPSFAGDRREWQGHRSTTSIEGRRHGRGGPASTRAGGGAARSLVGDPTLQGKDSGSAAEARGG